MKTKETEEIQVEFKISTDEEGNVIVSSADDQEASTAELITSSKDKKVVTLVGFAPEALKEFTELEIDESLYDNNNFARAVSEKIRLERALKE